MFLNKIFSLKFSKVTDIMGGTGSTAGVWGLGQYKTSPYKFNEANFSPEGLNSYKQEQEARKKQAEFGELLAAQMRGKGPSLAQNQLKQASDRAMAEQASLAASNRGVNPALAARIQAQTVAANQQQAAADAATLRAQEQLAAQQQYGQNVAGLRSGDLTATDRDLGAKVTREQLGVQARIGADSLNQSAYESASRRRADFISNIGEGLTSIFSDEDLKKNVEPAEDIKDLIDPSDSKGSVKAKDLDLLDKDDVIGTVEAKPLKSATKKEVQIEIPRGTVTGSESGHARMGKVLGNAIKTVATMGMGGITGAAGAAGGAAGMGEGLSGLMGSGGGSAEGAKGIMSMIGKFMSDKDAKKEISPDSKKVKDFLDALKAYTYEYKDSVKDSPLAGEGRYTGVMAQDLEKSELGSHMVEDTEQGKVVDFAKGFGTILAAQANLNKRLKDLEDKKKGK
jgi:hypothetical protein